MAALLTGIGILPWTAPAPVIVRVLAVLALLGAVLVASAAWGLARSAALDVGRRADALAEAELDAVLFEAAGGLGCACGHDHDADGLHVQPGTAGVGGPACGAAADADCTHTCDTCVLANLRSRS